MRQLLSIARKKPQKSLSARVSEISTFWQRIYFMQFLSYDVCIDTIGSVVHDAANIEIIQSKFIDGMRFKKNTVKHCKPLTPKSGRGRLKMVVHAVPTTGL